MSERKFDDALTELDGVYRDLNEDLQEMNPKCEASGACCNLQQGGYILYASELETERVRQATGSDGPWPLRENGECPFLNTERKCSIHADRPLGCRTFFCDPSYRPYEGEVYQKFITAIGKIATRHGISWNYQPFHGESGRRAVENHQPTSINGGTDRATDFPIVGQ